MKPIKTPLSLAAAIALGAFASNASAQLIMDNYVGADDHGHGDVIGTPGIYDVDSMVVTLDAINDILNVTINTNYAGKAGSGNTGYGDLFLSSKGWHPYGSAPYTADNNANGTQWDYAFSLDKDHYTGNNLNTKITTGTPSDRYTNNTGGTGTLYKLAGATNDANAILSEDITTNSVFRNGQEVVVDKSALGSGVATSNTGDWGVGAGTITFSIDISGTDLATAGFIGLHWGMTCGNDVIEGVYVPEPGILMLLSLGLSGLGLAAVARRKA